MRNLAGSFITRHTKDFLNSMSRASQVGLSKLGTNRPWFSELPKLAGRGSKMLGKKIITKRLP